MPLGFSAAPPATAESPKVGPCGTAEPLSALFTSLSLHQLGAEGPPWDSPPACPMAAESLPAVLFSVVYKPFRCLALFCYPVCTSVLWGFLFFSF